MNNTIKTSRIQNLNFKKQNGLLPVIVQHFTTKKILMLGFMNQEALNQTLETSKVTFWSRSRSKYWVKGETSGNFLFAKEIYGDCDKDTILVLAQPVGPTCHLQVESCFDDPEDLENQLEGCFLYTLEQTIEAKKQKPDPDNSYVSSLLAKGCGKIGQKVIEEAGEMVIAALTQDKQSLLNESADLLFHFLVLLSQNNVKLSEVIDILDKRRKK